MIKAIHPISPKSLRLTIKDFTLSPIKYKFGTNSNVTKVANNTPKARETTIGIRNCACTLVSDNIGNSPTKVVKEVSIMARKRSDPA